MSVWISGMIAVTVVCVFLFFMKPKEGNYVTKRLRFLQSGTAGQEFEEIGDDFFSRVVSPILNDITQRVGGGFKRFSISDIDKKLMLAGRPLGLSAEQFLALKLVVATLVSVLLIILTSASEGLSSNVVLFGVIGFVVGWFFVDLWIDTTIKERQKAIQIELPGVLDVLVITTEAGLNFNAAIQRIVETSEGVLVDEFKIVSEDIRLNKPRGEALRMMAERCGVDDLSIFLKSVIQAESLGASGIARTLHVHADSIRTKLRQRIEEAGNKSAVTMLLPTVLFILPSLFGVVLGGAMIDMLVMF